MPILIISLEIGIIAVKFWFLNNLEQTKFLNHGLNIGAVIYTASTSWENSLKLSSINQV